MEHILITAGGTAEAIDGVRKISNTATGSLGACIYYSLTEGVKAAGFEGCGFKVHYVLSDTAVRPQAQDALPIEFYEVTDVESLASVLEKIMTQQRIKYIIHSMAVSDFKKGYIVERQKLVTELVESVLKASEEGAGGLSPEKLTSLIGEIMDKPAGAMEETAKISSEAPLMLALNQTPKLISMFKKWNPQAFLIGFKLMKGVSEQELTAAAAVQAEKSGCDLVLANDIEKITGGKHEGLLIKGNQVVAKYESKKEIATGIAEQIFQNYKAAVQREKK